MDMNLNANRTCGGRRKAVGVRRQAPLPVAPAAVRLRDRGFTLTELLVVISIIAVLAALATVAAINALNAARRTRIATEISEISRAVESFKEDYGVYPPSGQFSPQTNQSQAAAFVRMFKKAFPRHKERPALLLEIAGDGSGQLQGGLAASEAVYFWLGGFSDDPEFPISGKGGPSFDTSLQEIVEDRSGVSGGVFDVTRLGPRNNGVFDGRSITYPDPHPGSSATRQINFWTYSPSGFQQPYIYFDASRDKPYQYDPPASSDSNNPISVVYALKKVREGFSGSPAVEDLEFANSGKYQVLHAGIDDAWGDMSGGLLYPDGPFTGEVADTLTNFSGGPLADAQEQ